MPTYLIQAHFLPKLNATTDFMIILLREGFK